MIYFAISVPYNNNMCILSKCTKNYSKNFGEIFFSIRTVSGVYFIESVPRLQRPTLRRDYRASVGVRGGPRSYHAVDTSAQELHRHVP